MLNPLIQIRNEELAGWVSKRKFVFFVLPNISLYTYCLALSAQHTKLSSSKYIASNLDPPLTRMSFVFVLEKREKIVGYFYQIYHIFNPFLTTYKLLVLISLRTHSTVARPACYR